MSKNSEYWAERAEAAVLRAEKLAENAVPEMIRAFERAKRDLQNEILAFFGRYAKNNQISLAEATKALSLSELKDFRESLKAFTELAKECIGTYNLELENLSIKARVTRLEALEFECDSILQRLYQEQREQTEAITAQAYTEGYYHRLFDIERYAGFQMPFSRVNTKAIEAVLKYPVNGADISTRLWRQDMDTGFKIRETLMNIFTTGRPPQDFAEELSKIIGAHDKDGNLTGKKYEAYRLLYNEVSYATGKAHLDAYEADGIDQYECVETLDMKTCEHCGHMDGKIFDREKAVVGETYPPFHVGCRGTTAPYIPSMREFESERAARDPVTGKTVYVKDMTYEEWRKEVENRSVLVYSKDEKEQPNLDAKDFDLEKHLETYQKDIKAVPEPNRSYLEYYAKTTEYEQRDGLSAPFAYSPKEDKVLYDIADPFFNDLSASDFIQANTHELAHRIDVLNFQSWKDEAFCTAVAQAKEYADAHLAAFREFAQDLRCSDYLADIISAITMNQIDTKAYHSNSYWKRPGNAEKEIFANLFSIVSWNSKPDIQFLKNNLSGLLEKFEKMLGE